MAMQRSMCHSPRIAPKVHSAQQARLGVADVEQAVCAKEVCLDLMPRSRPFAASSAKQKSFRLCTAGATCWMWLVLTRCLSRETHDGWLPPSYAKVEVSCTKQLYEGKRQSLFDVTSLWELIAVAGDNALGPQQVPTCRTHCMAVRCVALIHFCRSLQSGRCLRLIFVRR